MKINKKSWSKKEKIFTKRSLAQSLDLVRKISQSGKYKNIDKTEQYLLAKKITEIVKNEYKSNDFINEAKSTTSENIDLNQRIQQITEYISTQ